MMVLNKIIRTSFYLEYRELPNPVGDFSRDLVNPSQFCRHCRLIPFGRSLPHDWQESAKSGPSSLTATGKSEQSDPLWGAEGL
ncbi:hypothetical protein FHY08_001293 [Pseudomonas koreensis]|nr:hypothetical protein [Pseudomonas koreensis]